MADASHRKRTPFKTLNKMYYMPYVSFLSWLFIHKNERENYVKWDHVIMILHEVAPFWIWYDCTKVFLPDIPWSMS